MSTANGLASGRNLNGANAGQYPINLRLTIPFFPRALFVTVVVGPERRSPERRTQERVLHPVNTWGNVVTVTIALGVISVAASFAALVVSAA